MPRYYVTLLLRSLRCSWSRRLSGCVAIYLVSACGQHNDNRMPQPGDRDSPQVNPTPTQTVRFTAIVPDGFSAEFHLIYSVDFEENGSTVSAPLGCRLSQSARLRVDMPLKLERSAGKYRGNFSIDYFQGGTCGWHLYDVMSPMLDTWLPTDTSGPVIFFLHSLHTNAHPYPFLDLENQRIDIWCTHAKRRLSSQAPVTQPFCTNFGFATSFYEEAFGIPRGFSESVPLEKRDWDNHGTQYLRSLTVEYHDLDALVAAYRESHK